MDSTRANYYRRLNIPQKEQQVEPKSHAEYDHSSDSDYEMSEMKSSSLKVPQKFFTRLFPTDVKTATEFLKEKGLGEPILQVAANQRGVIAHDDDDLCFFPMHDNV